MASLPINRSISGASGAAVGEAMGYLIAKEAYKKNPSQLNETEKQMVAALSTLASGLAGALAGNSTEAVATAAKAGQTTVENNQLHPGDLIPPRVQQDSYLAVDLAQKVKGYDEINAAINASHIGPSWGPTYKVKTNRKVEIAGGIGPALKGEMKVDNYSFFISQRYTKEFGVKAGASIGIDFGPYAPGEFGDLSRGYSTSLGFGPGSVGLSIGKDGFGFSVSVGPSFGFTGSSTARHSEKIDINSDTSKEIYHYDFK
ncbi:polymorphic toxin type 25 domain-containing protein [Cronobacter dublinensis]|uniref:polymorphic toxin type 25 domain-containing protein n=1 Tax=Cronobacter dublinensis TaxID=413497 RepID=UPI001375C684|nr:polymorphic toxin type 25 domain-containing protein [Cronobacter dublinensis]NCH57736.1 hypothetical protein [Cronobacter dublinensis]